MTMVILTLARKVFIIKQKDTDLTLAQSRFQSYITNRGTSWESFGLSSQK